MAEVQSAPPPRWAWLSQQLANSGIDPDQGLGPRRRAALLIGSATIILGVWQAVAGHKGPISALLPVVGFFAELAAIAVGVFCGLFVVATAVIWVGRRLSLW